MHHAENSQSEETNTEGPVSSCPRSRERQERWDVKLYWDGFWDLKLQIYLLMEIKTVAGHKTAEKCKIWTLRVRWTHSTSTLSISHAILEQDLSLMNVGALKRNVCNFLPSQGLCISLSVLQSSHRPALCFRAKSWLKVQSSVEEHDSTKIFLHHLFPSYLCC